MTKKELAVAVALMQADSLSKLIGQIGRASAKLVEQIQTAAVQCVAQSIVHRNATPAMQLFDAMGSGSRRDALVAYLELWGNLMWAKSEKKITFCDRERVPGGSKLEWTPEYSAKVADAMWLKAKAEPTPKSIFDVDEEAGKFLERLTRAKRRGAELKNSELLNRLEATYHAYVAEQYAVGTTGIPSAEDVVETAKTDRPKAEQMNKLIEKFGGKPVALPKIEKAA